MSGPQLISIVDDDRAFRDSMRRLLKSLGYAVAAFSTGAEFLASVELDVTDCLVADIQMPSMTGIELFGRLMKSARAIPTILVTAYPNDRVQQYMLAQGVLCYLRKPLEEAELIHCLHLALARERAPKEAL